MLDTSSSIHRFPHGPLHNYPTTFFPHLAKHLIQLGHYRGYPLHRNVCCTLRLESVMLLRNLRTQRPEPSKPNMGIRGCRYHQHVPKGSWLRPGKISHSLKSLLSCSVSRAEKYYEVRLFESNKDCFIIHNNESTTAGLAVDVSGSTSWRQLDE